MTADLIEFAREMIEKMNQLDLSSEDSLIINDWHQDLLRKKGTNLGRHSSAKQLIILAFFILRLVDSNYLLHALEKSLQSPKEVIDAQLEKAAHLAPLLDIDLFLPSNPTSFFSYDTPYGPSGVSNVDPLENNPEAEIMLTHLEKLVTQEEAKREETNKPVLEACINLLNIFGPQIEARDNYGFTYYRKAINIINQIEEIKTAITTLLGHSNHFPVSMHTDHLKILYLSLIYIFKNDTMNTALGEKKYTEIMRLISGIKTQYQNPSQDTSLVETKHPDTMPHQDAKPKASSLIRRARCNPKIEKSVNTEREKEPPTKVKRKDCCRAVSDLARSLFYTDEKKPLSPKDMSGSCKMER